MNVYHWADVAAELPHAVTEAMIFDTEGEPNLQPYDIGTMFTRPANYLRHLRSVSLYASDRWDTPNLAATAHRRRRAPQHRPGLRAASTQLYGRIVAPHQGDGRNAGLLRGPLPGARLP